VYALSGLADSERGWGRAGESWAFLSALKALGGPSWFQLGDKDLALNVLRTHALRSGVTLSEFCTQLCRRLGVAAHVLPASEDPVRTEVLTAEGCLPFQNYFVEKQCEPRVREIRYAGAPQARPHPLLLERLRAPDTAAVILAPSNPWLSIGPILASWRSRGTANAAPVTPRPTSGGGRTHRQDTGAFGESQCPRSPGCTAV
jgi:LPPG:FO 2-phospho-L-lactate transferase